MTIENLRCFLILAECLNFSRAAEKAHVTQAAMSRRISSIESQISAPLFVRNHHQVELTNAGQDFYSRISPLIKAYDAAVIQAQNVDKGVIGILRIGVGIYEHALLLPVIHEFTQRYPAPKLTFVQYKYRELLSEFERDQLDLIVSSDQFFHTTSSQNQVRMLLHDRPWRLILNRNNPLAAANPVKMEFLETQNLITMHEGSINSVRRVFAERFPVKAIDHVNSRETKLLLVNANRGVGFLPSFVDVSSYPEIVTRGLEPPYRPRKFFAVFKKNTDSPYARCLAEMLEEYYRPLLWMQELTVE